jgi:hypothetical protein
MNSLRKLLIVGSRNFHSDRLLESENARLREEIERLQKELEAAQRTVRRQAAPFSRGQRKSHPKSPGRKPGARYGAHSRRPVPERVDEEIPAPVPAQCPTCAGPLTLGVCRNENFGYLQSTTYGANSLW